MESPDVSYHNWKPQYAVSFTVTFPTLMFLNVTVCAGNLEVKSLEFQVSKHF